MGGEPKEAFLRSVNLKRLTRAAVKKICRGGEGLGPIRWRHVCLEQEGAHHIIDGAKSALGLPILL